MTQQLAHAFEKIDPTPTRILVVALKLAIESKVIMVQLQYYGVSATAAPSGANLSATAVNNDEHLRAPPAPKLPF
jgi:hypothetical protein